MHNAHITVLERNSTYTESFSTEPYEAGWAREATWFVNALAVSGGEWEVVPEISPDGIHWCPQPGAKQLLVESVGLSAIPLERFGNWIRLTFVAPDADQVRFKSLIHLVLK